MCIRDRKRKFEKGARALGNRSILADPRRSDMKDILNLKIKRRESFRPFAPSIMREYVSEWFETEDEVPFMMKVFQIKNEKNDVVSLSWVTGQVISSQELGMSISWTPNEPGRYSIDRFVWDSIKGAIPLTDVISTKILIQ